MHLPIAYTEQSVAPEGPRTRTLQRRVQSGSRLTRLLKLTWPSVPALLQDTQLNTGR